MAVRTPKKKGTKARLAPLSETPVFRRYTPPAVASPHPMPEWLGRKLAGLQRRFCLVRTGERLTQYWMAALILVAVQMLVDWLVDLPLLVRVVILAADLALLVWFFRKQVLPLILRPPNQEACALMVEKHWPKFSGRIIAAVQLARPRFTSESPDLVHALQEETKARASHWNFGEIVPAKVLTRRTIAALLVTAAWVALFIFTAPGSHALLERVFLLPAKVPRKTEIVCLSGNKVIPVGDSVLLEAEAHGIIPSHGRVTLVDDSGQIQEITLDPEKDHPNRFSLKINNVENPFSYTIRINDATSDKYEIKTLPRPNVLTIDCRQTYPAYTGQGTVKRTVGNLALLAGSRLQIHAVTNTTIVKATLKLVGMNQEMPLVVGGPDHKDLTGEISIPVSKLTGFSIRLTDQAGITSGDETQYPIDIILDRPPTIEITEPEQLDELCTLKAQPVIAFDASDDYGLAKVSLCYRIVQDADADSDTTAPVQPPKRIEMDLDQGKPLSMQRQYVWDLAATKPPLTEETTIEYWMEAKDANNVTGPGIGESEHHTIKIVSEMEKKAEVMQRLMESLSATDDILDDQKKTNSNLGAAIEGKSVEP